MIMLFQTPSKTCSQHSQMALRLYPCCPVRPKRKIVDDTLFPIISYHIRVLIHHPEIKYCGIYLFYLLTLDNGPVVSFRFQLLHVCANRSQSLTSFWLFLLYYSQKSPSLSVSQLEIIVNALVLFCSVLLHVVNEFLSEFRCSDIPRWNITTTCVVDFDLCITRNCICLRCRDPFKYEYNPKLLLGHVVVVVDIRDGWMRRLYYS